MQKLHITFFYQLNRTVSSGMCKFAHVPLNTFAMIRRHLPRLPNKLLDDSHLRACEQATFGGISRLLEPTEEALGDF